MDIVGVWLSPLLLLPGAGLLIMSTSQRFNRLHDEIHHIMEEGSGKCSDWEQKMSELEAVVLA